MASASTVPDKIAGLKDDEEHLLTLVHKPTYQCAIGKHILHVPVYQLKTCGHKACKKCFEELLKLDAPVTCPGNEEECLATTLGRESVFCDKATDRELLKALKISSPVCKTDLDTRIVSSKIDMNLSRDKPVSPMHEFSKTLGNTMISGGGHQETIVTGTGKWCPNTGGQLVWKLTDYRYRKKQAIEGTVERLHSTPFYTHPYGYKMCARIYLNGHDKGFGTHASLYLVIMKGEYDAILHWPFVRMVTFGLLDQRDKVNRIHAFSPDPMGRSVQKPVEEMNFAIGSPLFVNHDVLESDRFLQDDTIFIGVSVDLKDFDHFGIA